MSTNFKYNINKIIKPYVKYIPQLTKPVCRVLIQVCVHYLESKKCSPEVLDLALQRLTNQIPDNFCELFAVIFQIMKLYLSTPKGLVKDDELRDSLRELKFTEECIDDISKVLHNHRESLTKNYIEAKCLRSPPKRLQWRINISLMDSGIFQLAQPTIVLHFETVNGECKTLELSLSMFHRLRYNLSLLIREMQTYENSRSLVKKY